MCLTTLCLSDFAPEFDALAEDVQDEMLAHAKLLEQFGPQLGRPPVDTLNGSPSATGRIIFRSSVLSHNLAGN